MSQILAILPIILVPCIFYITFKYVFAAFFYGLLWVLKSEESSVGTFKEKSIQLGTYSAVCMTLLIIYSMTLNPFTSRWPKKSRQSEAKTNLYHIYTLQMAIHSDKGEYKAFDQPMGNMGPDLEPNCVTKNELGFRIDGCIKGKVRYTYFVTVSKDKQKFSAYSVNYPGPYHIKNKKCAVADVWKIDQDKNIQNVTNALTHPSC